MEASKVVPGGVQLGSLDQLKEQQPGESELHLVPLLVHLLTFWADLFYVSPVPKFYHTPRECAEIRHGLSEDPCPHCRPGTEETLLETVERKEENGPMNGPTREGRPPAQGLLGG